MKNKLNEGDKYLLEIFEMQNIKKDITEIVKGIYDSKELGKIYAYIRTINNK